MSERKRKKASAAHETAQQRCRRAMDALMKQGTRCSQPAIIRYLQRVDGRGVSHRDANRAMQEHTAEHAAQVDRVAAALHREVRRRCAALDPLTRQRLLQRLVVQVVQEAEA